VGLFFEQHAPDPRLVQLIAQAIQEAPPADANATQQRAKTLVGENPALVGIVSDALAQPAPTGTNPAQKANTQATQVANQLLGGASFNTGRFVIALLIFALLLGGGIAANACSQTASGSTLFALATTVFGVVSAFLGTEKSGTS
jgi:hypothetical protein